MTVTARQFWTAVAVLVVVVVLHAAMPRYEWRQTTGDPLYWTRIDRWTGAVQLGAIQPGGAWRPLNDPAFKRPRTE